MSRFYSGVATLTLTDTIQGCLLFEFNLFVANGTHLYLLINVID